MWNINKDVARGAGKAASWRSRGAQTSIPNGTELSLPVEGDLGCMWIGTIQEERTEGETGDKTWRSGEEGARRCVLEDLSRSVSRNFGAKNDC